MSNLLQLGILFSIVVIIGLLICLLIKVVLKNKKEQQRGPDKNKQQVASQIVKNCKNILSNQQIDNLNKFIESYLKSKFFNPNNKYYKNFEICPSNELQIQIDSQNNNYFSYKSNKSFILLVHKMDSNFTPTMNIVLDSLKKTESSCSNKSNRMVISRNNRSRISSSNSSSSKTTYKLMGKIQNKENNYSFFSIDIKKEIQNDSSSDFYLYCMESMLQKPVDKCKVHPICKNKVYSVLSLQQQSDQQFKNSNNSPLPPHILKSNDSNEQKELQQKLIIQQISELKEQRILQPSDSPKCEILIDIQSNNLKQQIGTIKTKDTNSKDNQDMNPQLSKNTSQQQNELEKEEEIQILIQQKKEKQNQMLIKLKIKNQQNQLLNKEYQRQKQSIQSQNKQEEEEEQKQQEYDKQEYNLKQEYQEEKRYQLDQEEDYIMKYDSGENEDFLLQNQEDNKYNIEEYQLLEWKTGLINMGNTCFFNSAVQMMIHCLDIIQWKSQSKSQMLKIFLELQSQSNQTKRKEVLKFIYDLLKFSSKQETNHNGNDPVRVISSIIQQSKEMNNKQSLKIQTFFKKGEKDYLYWAADNSDISFLFQSVIFSGLWCKLCSKTQLINEKQNFCFNISSQSAQRIQDVLNQNSQQNIPHQTCSTCLAQQEIIDGFIKLPQFLFINIDENLMGKIIIDKQLIFLDQLRDLKVIYEWVGFICHPTFHYTYVRKSGKGKNGVFIHYNDENVSFSQFHNKRAYPIKGVLYSCIINQDPNIQELRKNESN